ALRYQHIKEIEDQIEILKSGKVSVAGEKDMGKFLDTRLDFINKFVDNEGVKE
ncbi:MAG: hypothetical protein GY782_00985, partial [Gammaproteobacteria bacterium]|nr:hypothetical protein [Gammaproteobacteria bacterium]